MNGLQPEGELVMHEETARRPAEGRWRLAATEGHAMVDRDKVLSVLHKRFPGASRQQIAWAANAIVGLDDEWEVVPWSTPDLHCQGSGPCDRQCHFADRVADGTEFRMFQKRPPGSRR